MNQLIKYYDFTISLNYPLLDKIIPLYVQLGNHSVAFHGDHTPRTLALGLKQLADAVLREDDE